VKSRFTILSRLLLAFVAAFFPLVATAQFVPTVASPHAQRNALGMLRTKINIFQNATRTAPNFGQNAEGNVMGQFQELRSAFEALKQTLDARQWGRGADSLAELDAGLDILSEAFNYYQNDLALGRPAGPAIRDMCQILREGVQIWSQQLNKTATALRIGVG
jgi:hypothetical protein